MAKLLPLRGALKPYAWGLSARDSLAASLHVANGGTVDDPDAPAAELWLGTHPSGPSMVGQRALREVLGGDVEFLLKVLSVARPLSIQAHPDKERAARLHMEKPEHYKDDNHKPEMAVALTRTLQRAAMVLALLLTRRSIRGYVRLQTAGGDPTGVAITACVARTNRWDITGVWGRAA